TDGNVETWTVGANSGIATAAWFGSYQGNGPEWVNQDITINGVYYPNIDGNQLAGSNWAAVMNAAAGNPAYPVNPLTAPPASMLSQTAPLVAGTNDPLAGSGVPVQQQPNAGDSQTQAPAAPAQPAPKPTHAPAPPAVPTQMPVVPPVTPAPPKAPPGG
ncbi:hypothetical protein G6034_08530, partial [Arthrobacter sp. AETb3-4]|nr:hypothetical protein [Arthrobacter wenxiniae]